MPVTSLSPAERGAVGRLVRRHKVVFEVLPAIEFVNEARQCVGYDIALLGTHEGGSRSVIPGCERCLGVWEDLQRLARAVLPNDLHRTSTYEFSPFDHALYTSGTSERDDVRFVISIRHKSEYFLPVDHCEDQCRHDIEGDLIALGAQRGEWSEASARLTDARSVEPSETSSHEHPSR